MSPHSTSPCRASHRHRSLLESRPAQLGGGFPLRGLLVDDSPLSRKVQLKGLQELSINDVIEAKNGLEALRKLEELRYEVDFVLTDWNMPAMDGVTFVRELRKVPGGR